MCAFYGLFLDINIGWIGSFRPLELARFEPRLKGSFYVPKN